MLTKDLATMYRTTAAILCVLQFSIGYLPSVSSTSISENVLPPKLIGSELIRSSKNLTRRRRQEPINAEQFLDQEINYLIETAYDVIDQGIKKTEAHQRVKVFKRASQGWGVCIASAFDIYSDFVTNNRSLGNVRSFGFLWRSMYIGAGQCVGFGFPLLLGLPAYDLDCTPQDFTDTVEQFNLQNGLQPLFDSGLTTTEISSIVAEFDLWLRVKVNCVLDFEEEIAEAKEALFQVDELNAAMNLRISLEEEKEVAGDGGNRRNSVDYGLKNALKKVHLGKKYGSIKRKTPSHYYQGKYTASQP